MKEKNSFEKICAKLEENYILGENQITYVKKYLKSELNISEDKDMLLKVKVEAENVDANSLYSFVISMLAMFFSAIGVIIQLLPEASDKINLSIRIVYLIAIVAVLIFTLFFLRVKRNAIGKWRQYVLCAVNQLIEDQAEQQIERIEKPLKKNKKHSSKKGK